MPKKLKTMTNFNEKITGVVWLIVTKNTVKQQEIVLINLTLLEMGITLKFIETDLFLIKMIS